MTFITIVVGFVLGVVISYVVGFVALLLFYYNHFRSSE